MEERCFQLENELKDAMAESEQRRENTMTVSLAAGGDFISPAWLKAMHKSNTRKQRSRGVCRTGGGVL